MRENVSPHDDVDEKISASSVVVEGCRSGIVSTGNSITCYFVTQAQFSRFLNQKQGPKVTIFRLAGTKVTEQALNFRSGRKIFLQRA